MSNNHAYVEFFHSNKSVATCCHGNRGCLDGYNGSGC